MSNIEERTTDKKLKTVESRKNYKGIIPEVLVDNVENNFSKKRTEETDKKLQAKQDEYMKEGGYEDIYDEDLEEMERRRFGSKVLKKTYTKNNKDKTNSGWENLKKEQGLSFPGDEGYTVKAEQEQVENTGKTENKVTKKREIYFEKEKEPFPWEKNDEKYKKIKQEIEGDIDKSMKIDIDTMKSISNKFIETLAELELDRKNDLKKFLVKNAEEASFDNYGQDVYEEGLVTTGDAAIHALKSSNIENYNKIYEASLKEMIGENKEREKRINDLYALNEAFSKTYVNGEVPFEARRAAFFELNNINGTDYNSLKLRADLFEKITGKSFGEEFGVNMDNEKDSKEKELAELKENNRLDINLFNKRLNEPLYKTAKQGGFSADILYKAGALGLVSEYYPNGNIRGKIEVEKSKKWFNPKTWFFGKIYINYDGQKINIKSLENEINRQWSERENKIIEEKLKDEIKYIKSKIEGLTKYRDETDNKRIMDAMKEQLENDFIARKLKTEKGEELDKKYEEKGEKFDMREFAKKTSYLWKTITGKSDFDNNSKNISDFMNSYGLETTYSDILNNNDKMIDFVKAAKEKGSLMRFMIKMILDKI